MEQKRWILNPIFNFYISSKIHFGEAKRILSMSMEQTIFAFGIFQHIIFGWLVIYIAIEMDVLMTEKVLQVMF
jgi:hypothetical protein